MDQDKLKQRNRLIDILKFAAITMVVIGHSFVHGSEFGAIGPAFDVYDVYAVKFIYSFHMAIFVLISGYLFAGSVSRYPWKNILTRKICALAVPILSWNFIQAVYLTAVNMAQGERLRLIPFLILFLKEVVGGPWFLWAILVFSLGTLLVHTLFHDSLWVYLLGYSITFFVPDSICPSNIKSMYLYFILGYMLRQRNFVLFGKNLYSISLRKYVFPGITALFFFMLLFFKPEYRYAAGYYILNGTPFRQIGIDLFRLIIGLVGSVFFVLLTRNLLKFVRNIPHIYIYISKNTLGIYLISTRVFNPLIEKISNLIGANYGLVLLESAVVFALSVIGVFLIRRSKVLAALLLGANFSGIRAKANQSAVHGDQ